jgi:hypothetical protein
MNHIDQEYLVMEDHSFLMRELTLPSTGKML